MSTRHKIGLFLVCIGALIGVAPIAVFIFMSTFPELFDSNTILLWHYITAFGMVLYLPLGAIPIVVGVAIMALGKDTNGRAAPPNTSLERTREG